MKYEFVFSTENGYDRLLISAGSREEAEEILERIEYAIIRKFANLTLISKEVKTDSFPQ